MRVGVGGTSVCVCVKRACPLGVFPVCVVIEALRLLYGKLAGEPVRRRAGLSSSDLSQRRDPPQAEVDSLLILPGGFWVMSRTNS